MHYSTGILTGCLGPGPSAPFLSGGLGVDATLDQSHLKPTSSHTHTHTDTLHVKVINTLHAHEHTDTHAQNKHQVWTLPPSVDCFALRSTWLSTQGLIYNELTDAASVPNKSFIDNKSSRQTRCRRHLRIETLQHTR